MSNNNGNNNAMVPYGAQGGGQAQAADNQALLPAALVASPTALVLYGSNVEVVHITHPRVRQMLSLFVKNSKQRALWALPARDIEVFAGRWVIANVVRRDSYFNATLIQSRGDRTAPPCTRCAQNPGRGPFVHCVRAPGHFGGCCGNCKWPDYGRQCSYHGRDGPIVISSDEDSGDNNDGGGGGSGRRTTRQGARRALPPGSSADNALVIV